MVGTDPEVDPVPQILIVDDDPEILASLGESFTARFPEAVVEMVDSGTEALARIRNGPVDVAVVDYRMPTTDGLVVLRILHDEQPAARSVVLTAYPDMRIFKRAVNEIGVDRFFTKPPTPVQLHDAAEECLWEGYLARVCGDDEEAAEALAQRITERRRA